MSQKFIEAATQLRIWCDNNYRTIQKGDIVVKIQELGVSQASLNIWFTKLYQTTPVKHIQDLRIRDAMMMIRNNKYSVERVALEVGFSSASHLNRAMQKRVGMGSFEYKRTIKLKQMEQEAL